MTIYLTHDGDEGRADAIEHRLRPAIPGLKRVSRIEDIDQNAVNGAGRATVLLVGAASRHANVDGLIEKIGRHSRNLFFILLGGDMSAGDYKRLIQSGAADWVAEAAPAQEILDIVGRISAPAKDAPVETPVVVAFTPSAGGVGNSTLAIETAIRLTKDKATRGAKVALVDLDFQSSHVCDYLDIAPKFQFEEIAASHDRLDDQLLNAFISRHSSGLDVLATARSRFHARELSVEGLSTLFDRLTQLYAIIIIDLPLSIHAWTLPLLSASKGILVTGLNTIPGLRQIEETMRALREEPTVTAEVRAVVNRCDIGVLGRIARADHIARILGDEKRMFVRESRVATECVNVGAPMGLAYPSDRTVKDIAALAAFCTGLNAVPVRKRAIG
jgi:pilus assembly protein CpaE